jgi:hypothetical protein
MMVKQFLLNPDGSIPDGTNVALLEAKGIPLVVPTERWHPAPGFMLEERNPEQDEHGVWRQVWVEVVAPEPVFEPYEGN